MSNVIVGEAPSQEQNAPPITENAQDEPLTTEKMSTIMAEKTPSQEQKAPPITENVQDEPLTTENDSKSVGSEEVQKSVELSVSEQKSQTKSGTEGEEGSLRPRTPSQKLEMLRTLSSEYFLNKHSPSFKCLEQYLCSRSDLLITLNFFPPLTDPGLDDALNYIPPEEVHDVNGVDRYVKMCKDLCIVPISRIIKSLDTDTLNLKYYGLTLKQMRGLADALKVNGKIRTLILEDNWMSPEAVILISDILRENNSIRILNLRECRIGEEGAEKFAEGISSTQFLQELDLSFNSLGDRGLLALQASLIENSSIKKLNISHNNLTEISGVTLERILIENKTIEELDLSWNGFYTGPGNKKLCNGLFKNEVITWLNLAWNGIGTRPAMVPIRRYLKKTKTLQFLDLSFNRITQDALKVLKNGLRTNKSLTQVKLGYNIYTPDEAKFLASVLVQAKNQLALVDMEGMCVTKEFLQVKKNILRKQKAVIHGRILSNYQIYGPNVRKLLFERCRYLAMKPKKKKAKKDFGHFVLSLPDNAITKDEFLTALKKKKVKKLDKDLLNELMSKFATKKGAKINCQEMKDAYMGLYPDTVLPEEKTKKKKKKKKGKGKGKKKKAKKEGK